MVSYKLVIVTGIMTITEESISFEDAKTRIINAIEIFGEMGINVSLSVNVRKER